MDEGQDTAVTVYVLAENRGYEGWSRPSRAYASQEDAEADQKLLSELGQSFCHEIVPLRVVAARSPAQR